MAVTKEQILEWTGGSGMGADIYAASKKYGFTPADVEAAFGFVPGYSQNWVDQYEKQQKNAIAPISQQNPLGGMQGYTPSTITVNPKSTVQQQVADITKQGGPLMQLAETRGIQHANRRGLINSSLAAESAQRAVLDTALPIAQQDAGTYFNAQLSNQAAENRAREVTVDATNRAAELAYNRQTDMGLQQLRGEQQLQLDNLNNQNARLVAASQSAALIYSQAQNAIAAVMADPNTTPEVKQQLINKINEGLDRQIATVAAFSDVDVSGLLNFSGSGSSSAATTSAAKTALNAIRSTAGDELTALQQMYAYAVQNNLSKADVARELGITEEQVQKNLDKLGKSL